MSKKNVLFCFMISVLFSFGFKPPIHPPPPAVNTINATGNYVGGPTVNIVVQFASTTSSAVVAVRIYSTSCLQYQWVSNSGGFSIKSNQYCTTASGFTVQYKDAGNVTRTVIISGCYNGVIPGCEGS